MVAKQNGHIVHLLGGQLDRQAASIGMTGWVGLFRQGKQRKLVPRVKSLVLRDWLSIFGRNGWFFVSDRARPNVRHRIKAMRAGEDVGRSS
jgi:CHASE1-domain containing sensor protein